MGAIFCFIEFPVLNALATLRPYDQDTVLTVRMSRIAPRVTYTDVHHELQRLKDDMGVDRLGKMTPFAG